MKLLVAVAILATLATGVMAYNLGATDARVNPNLLADVYNEYNHLRVYEDGSYSGETYKGEKITGCIKTALCEKD